jgi:hypothetical protein
MRYSVHFVGAFFHVQEAHVFSTTDGMALEVFVVEGWDGDDVKLFLTFDNEGIICVNVLYALLFSCLFHHQIPSCISNCFFLGVCFF